MTDRELLELAAKAAGVALRDLDDRYDGWEDIPVLIRRGWNPLADDGEALRLAVKLDIPISSESANGTTWICRGKLQVMQPHKDDPYAATRRAIVRAAAEIGRVTL